MRENRVAEVVGQIYAAALDDMPWSDGLCAVADLCGAENAALVIADSRRGYSNVVTPRADPDVVSAYAEYWWSLDPTAKATSSAPVGQLTTLADTGRELFMESRFHNEFWRRSGLGAERIAANLILGEDMFSSVVLQAPSSRDEIDASMFENFSLLVPHFVRAVNISRRLYRMDIEASIEGVGGGPGFVGIYVVDDGARVAFADAGAETLLRQGRHIRAPGGVLGLGQAEADNRLRTAIRSCAAGWPPPESGRHVHAARGDGSSPLQIEVVPCRAGIAKKVAASAGGPAPVAMLVVRDDDLQRRARVARLRERYGLTRAEATLTVEMLKGDGRAAAAARCGVSINTARTHLMRVFDKTGVSRQAELIRLLLD